MRFSLADKVSAPDGAPRRRRGSPQDLLLGSAADTSPALLLLHGFPTSPMLFRDLN